MSEVNIEDMTRNQYIGGSISVASIMYKMRKNRLKLLGNVLRREETEAVIFVKYIYDDGKSGKERPKKRQGL